MEISVVFIQGNSGPMFLHKCLSLDTCIHPYSNRVCRFFICVGPQVHCFEQKPWFGYVKPHVKQGYSKLFSLQFFLRCFYKIRKPGFILIMTLSLVRVTALQRLKCQFEILIEEAYSFRSSSITTIFDSQHSHDQTSNASGLCSIVVIELDQKPYGSSMRIPRFRQAHHVIRSTFEAGF